MRGDEFVVDDGSPEAFLGAQGGDLLALSHFDTGGRTVLIDQISVLWNSISRSSSPTLALYSDPDGNGNPSNAVPILIYPLEIPPGIVIQNSSKLQDYSIPPTLVSGSFFVGAFISGWGSNSSPVIGVDLYHPHPHQSWVLQNSSEAGSMDLADPVATSTVVGPLDAMNFQYGIHMIRARYTVVPPCVPPPPGVVSWWRAENSPLDAIGSNDGLVVGTIGYADGMVQRAFVFDGVSRNRLDLGNPTNLHLQDFSIEAWIKRSSATDISQDDLGEDGSLTGEGGSVLSYGHGGYGFGLLDDGRLMLTKVDQSQVTGQGVSDTNWHHVAVTKHGTNVAFYVDGIGAGTSGYGAAFEFSSRIAIGSRGDAGGGTFWGMIDEPAIYNRALMPDEIQGTYAAGGSGKCVHTPSLPPAITSQPEDQAKPVGGIATFATLATGTPPLHYQWYFYGNAMEGRTSGAFSLTNLQPEHAGPYFVVVTNFGGSVTSATAQLSVVATSAPVCVEVPHGVVAWWRAESNSVDAIGVNDGFFYEQDFFRRGSYAPGMAGASFSFRPPDSWYWGRLATNNYLFIPASADLDLVRGAGLTLEGWIWPNSVTNVQPLIEWNDGAGNVDAGLSLNGTALEASLTDTNTTSPRTVHLRSPPGVITTSLWQHVALTFDQATSLATVYLNGTAVAQTNFDSFTPQTQAPVYLGYRANGSHAPFGYFGRIDEMTIYNRALSAGEIRAILNADSAGKCAPPPPACLAPPPGLVGWWRGETNLLDSVDSNDGQSVGLVGFLAYSNAVAGKGFHFEGRYVEVPSSSNLNVGRGPGLTLESWISPYPPGGSPYYGIPARQEFIAWQGATQGVSLTITNIFKTPAANFSAWQADLRDTQGQSHLLRPPASLAILDGWQHVALTYDKASGMAAFFFNGNVVTQANLGSFTPQTTGSIRFGYSGSYSNIFPRPPPYGLPIDMDEIGLYDRALSREEIRAIMLSRGAGKCREPPTIVSQPANLRVNQGGDAVFSVTAAGNPILKYQWRHGVLNMPGATASSLLLTNVQLAQVGPYAVRVTNAFGTIVSCNAILTVNRAPVADASATKPVVIAPLHCHATVVLDGSHSSDPDGDPLNCFWFVVGAANPLATGAVAVVILPVGTNWLTLVVDDGLATNAQTLSVEVLTTGQAITQAMGFVVSQVQNPHPLIVSLSAAEAALGRNEPIPAVSQLQAFQNQVRAQVAVPAPSLAQALISRSQEIIDVLIRDCGVPLKAKPKIGTVARDIGGTMRMAFNAEPGLIYIIEASTNLVDWEKIGVVAPSAIGGYEFEDLQTSRFSSRYYRIVIP